MRCIFPDKKENTLFFSIRNFVIRNSVHQEFSALGTLLLRNFVAQELCSQEFCDQELCYQEPLKFQGYRKLLKKSPTSRSRKSDSYFLLLCLVSCMIVLLLLHLHFVVIFVLKPRFRISQKCCRRSWQNVVFPDGADTRGFFVLHPCYLVTRYSVRRVRFEDMSSNATRILYQTDGMLLREAMIDSLLSRFGSFHYLFSILRLILFWAVLQASCSAQLSLLHAEPGAAPPNIIVTLPL